MKRIARHEEKERKERERQQKDKELAEAKAKLIRLELESQKRMNDFNSQLQEMRMLIASQASQGWSASSQAPPPPPHVPFFKTPAEEHVQVLVSQLHHPGVEGKDHATLLPHGDVIVSTPASQLPRVASPNQNIVEILPQPQDEAATSAVPEEAQDHPRLGDNVKERTDVEEEQPACHILEQAMEAGEDGPSSMPNVDEELVDYGDDKEDVEDNAPQDSQPLPPTVVPDNRIDPPAIASNEVHTFDPYAFN